MISRKSGMARVGALAGSQQETAASTQILQSQFSLMGQSTLAPTYCKASSQKKVSSNSALRRGCQLQQAKKSEKDYLHVGTHSDGDIGDLYVTTRSDGDKMQFACLLNGHKKQICQVSSKNAPLEHGLTIMTKLGEYMLSNPSVTARGFQQPFKYG